MAPALAQCTIRGKPALSPGIHTPVHGRRAPCPFHRTRLAGQARIRVGDRNKPENCGGRGARFAPGSEDPLKPGPATTMKSAAERVQHIVELKPEICSLDMGSMNMGPHVFVNTPGYLETMAVAIRDAGVLPELEVFEAG